ncbi:hypothetical protein [Mechercharimyces sp. CAU 1602]|uniref:hypothetical protein n=1 Tax=Mechercharimyces sp. CAU 1602 TaxID=2973933 RepID=UPI002163034B|nr:hypothetical protein [Mechercharimyces sp. CAU 1602]MCS1351880.1 hypothetical protein [Mechercharimyces sp. CAU 1602]
MSKKLILALTILLVLTACEGKNQLDNAEQQALTYVVELYTEGNRDIGILSKLTGRNKSKESIAHIPTFLEPTGEVRIASKQTDKKERRAIYFYFSPELTKGPSLKGIYMEKRGEQWIYAGDIKVDTLKHKSFTEAEKEGDLKDLKIEEWKKVELKGE